MSEPSSRENEKTPSPSGDGLMSLADAAREFDVSVRTLMRCRAQGRLPGIRRGRKILVRRADVTRALSWKDPITLVRQLLTAPDQSPLDSWLEGWKQVARLTADGPDIEAAWLGWSDAGQQAYPLFTVGDYRVCHLVVAGRRAPEHPRVAALLHALSQFEDERIARDALRELMLSTAPWTGL